MHSSHKDFIRADPRRSYYFSFSDGTPFFALGDTFTLTSPMLSETNRRAYLEARAGQPFNLLRIFASYTFNAWTGQPHAPVAANPGELWPWGSTPAAPDYDRLNPRYFQRFERILGELKASGLFAEISTTSPPGTPIFGR
ncbi:MAG: DUF4038 domain-containing protein [Verrucomicrobia bacterium]|nr:DUF4038 domain-containing protein [Verrucomicrobiota bacterium]